MNPDTDRSSESSTAALPPPLPERVRKRRVPVFVWIVLGISLLANVFLMAGKSSFGFMEAGYREFPTVDASLAWGDSDAEMKVAMLSLSGVILDQPSQTLFGEVPSPVEQLLTEIQAVTVDPSYDAILLSIDSPGGGVTASDDIYQALMRFKESDPERKIVVHVKDIAASGGYYAALAADQIVAQPTSLVGSIGVLISAVNLHKLGEKLGIEDVTLASSDNKALLNLLDPVNPEHTEILQGVVDDMYERFRLLVLEHRPFTAEFAEEHQLLDGRVFTLPDALELGLVDRMGYSETARETVQELLEIQSAAFYEVSYASSSFGWFSARTPQIRLPLFPRSRLMYLWTP